MQVHRATKVVRKEAAGVKRNTCANVVSDQFKIKFTN